MKKNQILMNSFQRAMTYVFCAMVFIGCNSFIDVDLPDTQLTGETVFNDIGTADAALANVYSKLSGSVLVTGNSNGISILLGSYTDELQTYNTGLPEFQFYQNSLSATDTSVASLWNGSYNLIYATNAIIEGLENSTTISQTDRDRIMGEALFLRSFIHFHLANLFGDIPYVTSTAYDLNAFITRTLVIQLYPLLLADLQQAESLMPAIAPSTLRVRADSNTVKSLMARIHLYNSEWVSAEIMASSVIESGSFIWVDSLDEVFLKNSPGTIWQLMRNQEGSPTHEAQSFVFTLGPPPNRALSHHMVDAFETNDLRLSHWVGTVTGTDTWYYPFKYKQSTTESISTEYSILFRLEEQYLIRAEARIHLGDLTGAKEDINKIRNRASLSDTSAESTEELMEALLHERRIEFFSELGHRFFDLKRTGSIGSNLSTVKPGWDATDVLWPIPESELLLNPNLLPQNPGY